MLFILSHPIQYISPLLKHLASKTDIEVCYYSDVSVKGGFDKGFGKEIKWDIPLLDGYKFVFVKNWRKNQPMDTRFLNAFNPGIIGELRKTKSKIVVINSWAYATDWLVLIFAPLFGKKIWLRTENPINKELNKSKFTRFLKTILLKHILFRFIIDKFLFIGIRNKKFYEYYGVADESRFIFTPYCVDNYGLNRKYHELIHKKDKIREKLGIPSDKKIILFTGKYIIQKQPLDLLKAFQLLPNEQYALIMVGEGELRSQMQQFIDTYKLSGIMLTGFVNQSEIWEYYVAADVFVMCSNSETWGLSVNEAMNFHLPVVVSEASGCSADLVKSGKNGFVFKEGDIEALASAIKKATDSKDINSEMGAASASIIQDYTIDVVSNNILKALKK
ncbi:MAG: glycosyltransferase family 4 protein [Bacteroidia bacterium]|nr:glycosyltransferase family 4 protein [Bacteroidia bacterium]